MDDFLTRTRAMLGDESVMQLQSKHVAVFGLGGVGGHAAETLCRGGIGTFTLVDSESFDETNINRQIFATLKTVGKKKVDGASERLLSINPQCKIRRFPIFFNEESPVDDLFNGVDYILDASDTVAGKMLLIKIAKEKNIPIISCMGTGNKLDPTAFRVADIYKTSVCPLARVIRAQCKKSGIDSLKVVYSEEEPMKIVSEEKFGRRAPASVSFVPGVAGMILAGEIIKDLI